MRRWALGIAGVLLLLAATIIVGRPPGRKLTTKVAVDAIEFYQHRVSGSLPGIRCRYKPVCSSYAKTCITRFGPWKGAWMALRRILRCGPWVPRGHRDPPPPALPGPRPIASEPGSAYPASGALCPPRGNYASVRTSHP